MTFQALAVLLVSWVVPSEAPRNTNDDLPLWERPPHEQRHLKDQAAREVALLSQITRGW